MAAKVVRDSSHEEFICAICKDFLDSPVKTRCNHLFCRDCLLTSLENKEECPFCRTPVSMTQYSVAKRVDDRMRATMLTCNRCHQQFKAINGRAHDAACVDVVVPERKVGNPSGLGMEVNRFVFPCAYCGEKNLSREGLLNHCNVKHRNAPTHKLVCSICVAYPWGETNKASGNLLEHMNLRHQFDYDFFVDLHEDEEQSLRTALEASVM
ncbi:E3 ubiquitin-protein ligase RNF114-like [Watersipora subatra]|uniref:E3 ubiquitin-protein ligase RNF114-like n=1 Tax=Watersipora subatra TaxID=2589382 RepID=UPI00355B89AB